MNFTHGAFGDVVYTDKARQPACELVKSPRRTNAVCRVLSLAFHAPGKSRRGNGDHKENDECEKLVRLGNGEFIKRLDKKEVVGKEGEDGRIDCGPYPEIEGGQEHRDKKYHREVGKRSDRLQRAPHQHRQCDAACRPEIMPEILRRRLEAKA